MAKKELLALAERIEAATNIDSNLAKAATAGLAAAFPEQAASGLVSEEIPTSTDRMVALAIAALPGWHFSIHGRARPAGTWTCSLRQSDIRDDDEVVGAGEGRSVAQAVLSALLRAAAWR